MSVQVVRSDARRLPLADGSVDLIVTSPPYFALRSYQDGGEHYAGQIGSEPTPQEFLDALIACTAEWMRVLKPSGSLWVNLGDKYGGRSGGPQGDTGERADREQAQTYALRRPPAFGRDKSLMGLPWRYALRCIDELGLILRAEVIWSKPNGLPESVQDRVRRSHEQWFHLTREPRYYSAVDEIREAYDAGTAAKYRAGYKQDPSDMARIGKGYDWSDAGPGALKMNPLGKLPGSVWTVATEPLKVPAELGVDHFAAFPTEWPRRIIAAWSPPGGVVVDPFGGTGTTALVAHALGRTGISGDLSHDYCRLATWRTTDPGQLAKAMCVDKPPQQVDGQAALFDSEGAA